jgi:colanic acid biosynthesis glycosyl transferase WcaI
MLNVYTLLQCVGESKLALYSGNIGAKQGLETVIAAAQRLQNDSRFVFVMCGHGAFYGQLRRLAQGVKNIQWHELQPIEHLNELLNLADIHLLPQRANAADLVMPSKLTGMLASGKPIIATALPGTQVAEVVKNTGIVVPPDDADSMVNAIKKLTDDLDLRYSLGKNARQYAEHYLDKEKILSSFKRLLYHT